jgi:transposase
MIYIGIDISKSTLDVFYNNTHKKWPNSQRGITSFIKSLPQDIYIIFEASGAYTKLLYKTLSDAGIRACCANPLTVRRFAQGFGLLAKTDKIDTSLLALYGEKVNPSPTHFLSDTQLELTELLYVRDAALRDHQAARNRLEMPFCSKFVLKEQEKMIAGLLKHIKTINDEIDLFMKRNQDYTYKANLLQTIPGIGPTTAQALLTYCPELGSLSHKEVVALAGLAPKTRQSGQMRYRECIGGGRKRLRKALYFPALSVIRNHTELYDLYERLTQNKKPGKLAITAVMRKILIQANAVLKRGTGFEKRDKQYHVKSAA